ncbi:MAG: hypothetical protein RIT27_1964 [Pseudomonadota bacterium]
MLQGRRILITRPAKQADNLCQMIEENGGIPIRFPTLEIAPPTISPCFPDPQMIEIAIWTSSNAVSYSKTFLKQIPNSLQLAAVGQKTAQALEKYGKILYPPHNFTSEGLLEMPIFQTVKNKNIAIFSGEGGRETLIETLQQRGANVKKIAVYQRIIPNIVLPPDIEKVDCIVISSGETLENLFIMLGNAAWLRAKPLVVISPRLADIARLRGITARCVVAPQADDTGLFNALITLVNLI